MNVLDSGHHEADIAGLQQVGVFRFGIKNTNLVGIPGLPGRLDDDLVALFQGALGHPHERHDAQIIVEPGIDDQSLQGRASVALGWRDLLDQIFQNIFHAQTTLGATANRIRRFNANDILDFCRYTLRFGLREIHLVQNRHNFETLLNGGVAVSH